MYRSLHLLALVEAWTGTPAVQTLQQHWMSLPHLSWSTLCSIPGPSVSVVAMLWQPAYRAQWCHIPYKIMIRNRSHSSTEFINGCSCLQITAFWNVTSYSLVYDSGWNYVPVQQHTIISLETSSSNLKIEALCTYKTLFTCLSNHTVSHTKNIFLVKITATFEYSTRTDLIP